MSSCFLLRWTDISKCDWELSVVELWKHYQDLWVKSSILWSRILLCVCVLLFSFNLVIIHSNHNRLPTYGTHYQLSYLFCADPKVSKIFLSVFSSGLPSRSWRFPRPTMFSSCRRAIPGSVSRVAACVQWPGQPLRSQVQSQGLGPCGGAGAKGAGWDSLLHRVLGHVYQWSLPGRRKTDSEIFNVFCHWGIHIHFFSLINVNITRG